MKSFNWKRAALTMLVIGLAGCGTAGQVATATTEDAHVEEQPSAFIVQGSDVETVAALVESVGGVVTHELGIIRAVGATVTPSQLELLRKVKDVRIRENRTVSLSDETAEKTPRGPDGSVDAAVTTVRAPNN